MVNDLQKANLWKRIAAWMFDVILTGTLVVGFIFLLSLLLGYDGYSTTLENAYARYEGEYAITFDISQEEYLAMSEAELQNYDAAYAALTADEEAMHAYNMMLNLTMVMTTGGILLAMLITDLIVPLLFGNGQTLGKKIFGLGVIRTDGVKMNNMQLFVRTILGKFTIETMIPVYILMMLFWGIAGLNGTLLLVGLLIAQIVIMAVTRIDSLIHDLLAGTVVVDISSQMIFRSTEDLVAYQKKIAAERAARQPY